MDIKQMHEDEALALKQRLTEAGPAVFGGQMEAQKQQTPMPEYISHKRVWALKIKSIQDPNNATDGSRLLYFEESGYLPICVDGDYMRKHSPQVGGYFVVYADGYKSWSPSKAFEEGYSPMSLAPPPMFGGQAQDEQDIMLVLPVFGYRQLNETGQLRATQVARIFSEALRALERCCPPGREFSLVRTKLEEGCMFAKKAIAVDPRYQG